MDETVNRGRDFPGAAALREACDGYFAGCDASGTLYGEAGLALALDVTLPVMRSWYDGKRRTDLQEEIQRAYLRIQSQIETDPAYTGKGGMSSRAVFLLKQPRFGGYQDKAEARQDTAVRIRLAEGVDESDLR